MLADLQGLPRLFELQKHGAGARLQRRRLARSRRGGASRHRSGPACEAGAACRRGSPRAWRSCEPPSERAAAADERQARGCIRHQPKPEPDQTRRCGDEGTARGLSAAVCCRSALTRTALAQGAAASSGDATVRCGCARSGCCGAVLAVRALLTLALVLTGFASARLGRRGRRCCAGAGAAAHRLAGAVAGARARAGRHGRRHGVAARAAHPRRRGRRLGLRRGAGPAAARARAAGGRQGGAGAPRRPSPPSQHTQRLTAPCATPRALR